MCGLKNFIVRLLERYLYFIVFLRLSRIVAKPGTQLIPPKIPLSHLIKIFYGIFGIFEKVGNYWTHVSWFFHASKRGVYSSLDGWGKMFEEKRKFKRFKGREGAFAAFIKPNELINLGQIQDISMGGLCVTYLSTNNRNEDYSAIKVFGSNGRFIHLSRIQCRIVYDYDVPEGSWQQISTRRCGVEFEDLSVKHQSMLQEFIDYFASDEILPQNTFR